MKLNDMRMMYSDCLLANFGCKSGLRGNDVLNALSLMVHVKQAYIVIPTAVGHDAEILPSTLVEM
jgi:hypothetical protein